MHLAPGRHLAHDYRLERKLGEGGAGVVWEAVHEPSQRRVALKTIRMKDSRTAAERLRREAFAMNAIHHPNVAEVLDVVEHDGVPLIVLPLYDGEALDAKLAREGKLDLHETASILIPVTSAVSAAHAAGVVHRDLKPHNIFLTRAEGGVVPKVLDFGIAKLLQVGPFGGPSLTSSGASLGTPQYMSPEQVFGERTVDHRADVWAVGVIAYECLSARRPFVAPKLRDLFKAITLGAIVPLHEVIPDVPRDVAAAIHRMLRVAPQDRAESVDELAAALARSSPVVA